MADVTIRVLEPATSYALLSLDELKTYLGITDASQDAQLQLLINQYSDAIARACNRVFAKEKVSEEWRGNLPPLDCYRIYLRRWPVEKDEDIELVTGPIGSVIASANWQLEPESGKLQLLGGWGEPVTVVYTGGYELPDGAPPALKQATMMMIQAAQGQKAREAVSGIRSISHRETRVQFFDAAAESGGGSSGGSSTRDAVKALLRPFIRINV
jgi:hypothetical protein